MGIRDISVWMSHVLLSTAVSVRTSFLWPDRVRVQGTPVPAMKTRHTPGLPISAFAGRAGELGRHMKSTFGVGSPTLFTRHAFPHIESTPHQSERGGDILSVAVPMSIL